MELAEPAVRATAQTPAHACASRPFPLARHAVPSLRALLRARREAA